MTKLTLRHPEEGLLLQYLDGEVTKRQGREIHGHLEACWECRAELEALESTVNDCVRYRKQILAPLLPAAPKAWASLDFGRIDSELAAAERAAWSLSARIGRWLSPRYAPLRWALSGALALAFAFLIVRQLRETPNVAAAALLHKAIAAGDTRPAAIRRLRITSSRGPLTRLTGAASIRPIQTEVELAHLFQTARYDWNDPLSAKAFASWHDALSRKLDEVASADPDIYSIKTTTSDNELVSATLRLRKTDLAPVEGRFEFRNHEWVEMTESVDQLNLSSRSVAGATGGMPRQPGVSPASSLFAPEGGEVPELNEELQVVAALHQVGADLGDPVEISREGRQMVVSGIGIAPSRQQQIRNVLDHLPHVAVHFSDPVSPASTPVQSEPATTRDAAGAAEKQTYTAQIQQRLGGRPQFERFSGQLMDWTDSAMSRAYALRRLAQQFPQSAESQMSAEDRRTLRDLGREYLAALQTDLGRIRTTISPVLTGISSAAPARERSSAAWQPDSEQVLASAHRVETLLANVLGVTTSAAPGDAPSQLLVAIDQLASDLEHCQRLLSRESR